MRDTPLRREGGRAVGERAVRESRWREPLEREPLERAVVHAIPTREAHASVGYTRFVKSPPLVLPVGGEGGDGDGDGGQRDSHVQPGQEGSLVGEEDLPGVVLIHYNIFNI
jgi:hypothetical protein